jgi:hypothetical protein
MAHVSSLSLSCSVLICAVSFSIFLVRAAFCRFEDFLIVFWAVVMETIITKQDIKRFVKGV